MVSFGFAIPPHTKAFPPAAQSVSLRVPQGDRRHGTALSPLTEARRCGTLRPMVPDRFLPAISVTTLLACGAVLSVAPWSVDLGIDSGKTLLLALLHIELALTLLLPGPGPQSGRRALLVQGAWLAACAASSSAALLCFAYRAQPEVVLEVRGLALACWAAAFGVSALGHALQSRLGGPWALRLRLIWLAVAALPVLWHYFALEYAQRSLLHLRPLSPHWLLAAFPDGAWTPLEYWPLVALAAATWLSAAILTRQGTKP